ncbi:MAG TPA: hypothetical protein VF432_09460 [Thermoanaerobaculia bacterium]
MIELFVLLAQIASTQPPTVSPLNPGEELRTTVVKLDGGREMTVMRNALGRPVRAVVRNTDGTPMTCDPYFAWVTHEYECGQGCDPYWVYTAYGHAGGTSRTNACVNARNDGCASVVCGSTDYGYCTFIEAVAGSYYDDGGGCGYGQIHDCAAGNPACF